MRVHACTFQKLHACVATASRDHANHTRVTRVRPFKLWVICIVCSYQTPPYLQFDKSSDGSNQIGISVLLLIATLASHD